MEYMIFNFLLVSDPYDVAGQPDHQRDDDDDDDDT